MQTVFHNRHNWYAWWSIVDSVRKRIEATRNLWFPLLRSTVDGGVGVRCRKGANIPDEWNSIRHWDVETRFCFTWTIFSMGRSLRRSPSTVNMETDVCTSPISACKFKPSASTSCGSHWLCLGWCITRKTFTESVGCMGKDGIEFLRNCVECNQPTDATFSCSLVSSSSLAVCSSCPTIELLGRDHNFVKSCGPMYKNPFLRLFTQFTVSSASPYMKLLDDSVSPAVKTFCIKLEMGVLVVCLNSPLFGCLKSWCFMSSQHIFAIASSLVSPSSPQPAVMAFAFCKSLRFGNEFWLMFGFRSSKVFWLSFGSVYIFTNFQSIATFDLPYFFAISALCSQISDNGLPHSRYSLAKPLNAAKSLCKLVVANGSLDEFVYGGQGKKEFFSHFGTQRLPRAYTNLWIVVAD